MTINSIHSLLDELGWLPAGKRVSSVSIAGEGNMNLVQRIMFDDGQTMILKRAHDFVEKYPDIPAPIERAGVEASFYGLVAGTSAGAAMPTHLGYNEQHAANLFEDLGAGCDGMHLYGYGSEISEEDISTLLAWMNSLHDLPIKNDPRLRNHAMRELNAHYIFRFPLDMDNDFDLNAKTPGLQETADEIKRDVVFKEATETLRTLYLSDADGVLLHGDLYPGSWLTTQSGLRIIDPEFCWVGPREWDIGILKAHLILARQPQSIIDLLQSHTATTVKQSLVDQFAGIEIMRRLMSVSQLPIPNDLSFKQSLLHTARKMVCGT